MPDLKQTLDRALGDFEPTPRALERTRRRIDRRRRTRRITAGVVALAVTAAAFGLGGSILRGAEKVHPAHVSRDVFKDVRGKILYIDPVSSAQVDAIDPSNPGAPPTSIPIPSGWSPFAWSRDGQHLLALITHPGTDLGVLNADGTRKRLTEGGAVFGFAGSFSPDGASVAVVGWGDDIRIVRIADRQTTTVVRNTRPHREAMFGSAWSPDGSTIVFIDHLWVGKGRGFKGQGFRSTIQAVSPDGSDRRVLRTIPSRTYEDIEGPVWSPDGTRLCFVLGWGGKNNGAIFVMDADGGNLRQLTPPRTQAWFPTWSPDGTQIAFVSGKHLMVMAADGSHRRSIGASGWSPVWTAPGNDPSSSR